MLLTSIRALITRPRVQGQLLAEAIQNRRGQVRVLPMLAIEPIFETKQIRNDLLELDQFDIVIVTSQHAAHLGLRIIEQYWPQLPLGLNWYAIGSQTAEALSCYGINAKWPSEGVDSEALLHLKSLHAVRQKRILVIKGTGGRTLMTETLKERGATIELLETYERKPLDYTVSTIPHMLRDQRINTIICGSGATVNNLLRFISMGEMKHLYLVVPSQRIAKAIEHLPFKNIIKSEGAGNNAVLVALEVIEHQLTRLGLINTHSEELL